MAVKKVQMEGRETGVLILETEEVAVTEVETEEGAAATGEAVVVIEEAREAEVVTGAEEDNLNSRIQKI